MLWPRCWRGLLFPIIIQSRVPTKQVVPTGCVTWGPIRFHITPASKWIHALTIASYVGTTGKLFSMLALGTHIYTNALWHEVLITNLSVRNTHNLYYARNGSSGRLIFHLILFHFISSNINPLNLNMRRHGALLFWQVKWLRAMMCFPASL